MIPVVTPTPENHTPRRSIRVPDEVWQRAQKMAEKRGENLSDVIRKYLDRYGRRG